MSVRERIAAIQREIIAGSVTPEQARQWLMTLTALLGKVHDEQLPNATPGGVVPVTHPEMPGMTLRD